MIMKTRSIRIKDKGQQPVPLKRNSYNKIANTIWFKKSFTEKKQGEVLIKI